MMARDLTPARQPRPTSQPHAPQRALVFATAFAACLLATLPTHGETTPGSPSSDTPLPEQWVPAEHPATLERVITAFTEPARRLALSSEFAGRVITIGPEAGERIDGDPNSSTVVAKLDDRFAALARDRASTALEQARRDEATARARLAIAEREHRYRLLEVDRIRELASKGKVPTSELDAVTYRADVAELDRKLAESRLALAGQAIEAAQIELDDAEERLARHEIRAPAGWTVLSREVEPGMMVSPGQPLLELADVSTLSIHARLSEAEVRALRAIGAKIPVEFVHANESSAQARLHRVDVDHDPVTLKRVVELRLPGSSAPEASGGLEVAFRLRVEDPTGSLRIPEPFLEQRLERYFVHLRDGRRLPIVPLRVRPAYVLVSPESLPADAVLIRPDDAP